MLLWKKAYILIKKKKNRCELSTWHWIVSRHRYNIDFSLGTDAFTYENSETTVNQWALHCMRSVQIRSFFWSVFSRRVNLRIQSNYGNIWTIKNSVFGHFSRSTKSFWCQNFREYWFGQYNLFGLQAVIYW